MRFKSHDALRLFTIVARHGSFTAAADALNLTKGAVSHQIRQLERELGFAVFERMPRGIKLTSRGQDLLASAQSAFEDIEKEIASLRRADTRTLTIGTTTYFASRWLSPRLMDFMRNHPDIRLRVQPMINLLDLRGEEIDLAIRWGNGTWDDVAIEPLFSCPAWPTGNADVYDQVCRLGLEMALEKCTLLRDRDNSSAWSHWFEATGFAYVKRADTLIIPDPNVRVQGVIDGQGIALNDDLVAAEINDHRLFRLSDAELSDYGYFLAFPAEPRPTAEVEAFSTWIRKCV